MAITFPYTFANLSGNVPASDLDSNFTYTTTLAANATVASSLTGSELILLAQGGVAYSATITQIVAAVGSGTATQANQLTTGRTIGMTGDVTYTSPTFNGTTNVTGTATVISASTSTAGKVQLAQASDVAAGTSTTLAVTPAALSGLSSGAKAFVRWSGQVTNGTCSILSSYNVTSVTRTSTGQYTIVFTNNLTDANYAIVGTAGGTDLTGNGGPSIFQNQTTANTSSTAYISVTNTGSGTDRSIMSAVVFR